MAFLFQQPKPKTLSSTLDDTFKGLGIQELQWLASMFPQYQSLLGQGFSQLGNPDAAIDRFRNQALQTASRIGKSNAISAGWQGLGSGSQASIMDRANQDAGAQIGNYAQYVYSPEWSLGQLGAAQQMLNPFFTNQFYDLSGKRYGNTMAQQQAKPKKNNFLGGLLNTGLQLAGGGMFGNPASWFGGGASAASKWASNPSSWTGFGTLFG